MSALGVGEAVVGGALLFFVPGFAVTRALFPEWRLRGTGALRRGLETATLSFVLSVTLTVLVGYGLLGLAPGGFSATWSDPLLEAVLAAIAVIAFATAGLEGAFSRHGTVRPVPAAEPGGEGAWELTRELDRLRREEVRLARSLRAAPPDAAALEAERNRVVARVEELERAREAEYAE
jgi:hypothetical protein